MKRTLYVKFLLAYVLLAILSVILISTLGASLVGKRVLANEGSALYREAISIASYQSVMNYTDDELPEVYDILNILSYYQDARILILNSSGTPLIDTGIPYSSDMSFSTLRNFDPAAMGAKSYIVDDFYGYFDHDVLSTMVPITNGLHTRGYVSMHISMDVIIAQRESILLTVYIVFLILYAATLLLLLVFDFNVSRPLKKITAGASAYAAGNLDYNIPVNTDDEMGYLASTLNYMSDELDKMGDYQKKFVANVSHDFRSPLTSIKGYVEAIMDGTIPPEMQDRYLKIVVDETERLEKLTQSLLTLDKMDSGGRPLIRSIFDINDTIKSTVAAFEVICRRKRIGFELHLLSGPLLVNADKEQIQQVLYNLIDNAIKFSRNDSSIKLETSERHGTVFVSVKDSGSGIAKSSINKIWDRFYKQDSSRGRDRKGTGLGLSIVKEIITAHNQNINVISTEGVGTEFIFTLERAK